MNEKNTPKEENIPSSNVKKEAAGIERVFAVEKGFLERLPEVSSLPPPPNTGRPPQSRQGKTLFDGANVVSRVPSLSRPDSQ
jgi:hypothetical protein